MSQTLHITAKIESLQPKELEYLSDFLNKLFALYDYSGIEISVTEERTVTKRERLIQAIETTLGVEWCDILMGGRLITLSYARMIFTHYMRDYEHTLEDIAGRLRRDHSTIHHYAKKYQSEYAYNPVFRNYVIQIEKIITNE
jgi:chromosomal replication initiation ATPase DnaA